MFRQQSGDRVDGDCLDDVARDEGCKVGEDGGRGVVGSRDREGEGGGKEEEDEEELHVDEVEVVCRV